MTYGETDVLYKKLLQLRVFLFDIIYCMLVNVTSGYTICHERQKICL